MPKSGDNITRTKSGAWKVKYKVKETVVGADGMPTLVWKDRTRHFETRPQAMEFKRDVSAASARGEVWRDERLDESATYGQVADAYDLAASAAPEATQRWRRSLTKAWLAFVGRDNQVSGWTLSLLEAYAQSLPSDGRTAATRHRKILEVERMWTWARRRLEQFPGVPEPTAITGPNAGEVHAPPPVVRGMAPTIADVDLMIGCLRSGWRYGDLHRRIALVLRYTGLRIGQAVGLRWDDLHLEDQISGPYLVIKAGRAGAKLGKGRAVPLHPALVAELLSWRSAREGLVFDPQRPGGTWEDGEATRTAFRTAWSASGVDRGKWDVTDAEVEAGERAHGSPCHAIRAAVKVALLMAGTTEDLTDYFVGHSKGATSGAYVPEHSPATSPYWRALRIAVLAIPDHRQQTPMFEQPTVH